MVVLSTMPQQVVRCSACMRVHDLTELLDANQLPNGTTTFTCPRTQGRGIYSLESVGTLHPAKPASAAAPTREGA